MAVAPGLVADLSMAAAGNHRRSGVDMAHPAGSIYHRLSGTMHVPVSSAPQKRADPASPLHVLRCGVGRGDSTRAMLRSGVTAT